MLESVRLVAAKSPETKYQLYTLYRENVYVAAVF